MPRPDVPTFPRAWPRVAVLAFIGVLAAGCSDSARFSSSSYSRQPPSDVTGSIATRPEPRVASRPLPAPSRPETVAANTGYADGAAGLGAYRPGERYGDITGSVPEHRPPAPPPPPAGHWTWDGGSPVTVGRGQSLEMIARKHGVPLSAIMQVNAITNPAAIRPGQRLVIPRYVSASEARVAPRPAPRVAAVAPPPRVAAVAPKPQPRAGEDVHIVAPGETMMGIARRHHISLAALAHANHIDLYAKLSIGQRLLLPGSERRVSENRVRAPLHAPAPRLQRPHPVAPESVASLPTQNVRMAKAEPPPREDVTKKAEPAGGMASFRWPVHGRIIASFGKQANGTQNDGINLAVPEGTPIKAADDGIVAYAGNELKGYGNLVLVRHPNGYVSAYANASQLLVKRGEMVKRGQVIARAGQTGNVNSPQLHFEIRKGSLPVDPTKYLGGA
jgi:murein DD-endopeptidase MepM/ murein hydrolase activator NlpD